MIVGEKKEEKKTHFIEELADIYIFCAKCADTQKLVKIENWIERDGVLGEEGRRSVWLCGDIRSSGWMF